MRHFTRSQSDSRRLEAERWAVLMTQPDLSEEAITTFTCWLEADERNRREFETAARILATPAFVNVHDVEALVSTSVRAEPVRTASLKSWWLGASFAALAGCTMLMAFLLDVTPLRDVRVASADRNVAPKLVDLPDTSRVYLNSASGLEHIEVDFTDRIRFAALPRGEVFFEVAHDPSRPFVVHTENTTIRVLGTKFNVRAENDRETISVLEGRVQVRLQGLVDGETVATNRVIGPGQQMTFNTKSSDWSTDEVDVSRLSAWRFGRVEFQNMPLEQAVAEINRYRSKPIIVEDAELGALPLSGSFSTDGTESFIAALRNIDHVEIIERKDSVMLLKLN